METGIRPPPTTMPRNPSDREEPPPSETELTLRQQLKSVSPKQKGQAAYRLGLLCQKHRLNCRCHYFDLAYDANPTHPAYVGEALFCSMALDSSGKLISFDAGILSRAHDLLSGSQKWPLMDELVLREKLLFYYDRSNDKTELSQEFLRINSVLQHLQGPSQSSIGDAYASLGSERMAQVAKVYNTAGVIKSRHHHFESALHNFTYAAALKGASGGVDGDLALYLENAGNAYWDYQQYESLSNRYSPFAFLDDTAERYLRQALLIYEQQFGVLSHDVADTLFALSFACKHCDSDDYRDQAIAIYRLTIAPDDRRWGYIYFRMATLKERRDHPKEAFELYAHALEAIETTYGLNARELIPVMEEYVKALNRWGNKLDRFLGADAWMNAGGWTVEYTKQLEARIELIKRLHGIADTGIDLPSISQTPI